MRLIETTLLLCAAWHLSACGNTHRPSLVPLGHGPLSRAERDLEAEHATTRHDESLRAQARPLAVSSDAATDTGSTSSNLDPSPDKPGSAAPMVSQDPQSASTNATPNDDAAAIDAWLGLFRGNDSTVFVMPEQPNRRFDDSKAKIRVQRAARNHLSFALVDSSNEKDICDLSASVQGDTATIDAGQSCFLDPDEEMTVKSRPGKALLKNRRLSLELVLDTLMETEVGEIRGSIEYHFEGER